MIYRVGLQMCLLKVVNLLPILETVELHYGSPSFYGQMEKGTLCVLICPNPQAMQHGGNESFFLNEDGTIFVTDMRYMDLV